MIKAFVSLKRFYQKRKLMKFFQKKLIGPKFLKKMVAQKIPNSQEIKLIYQMKKSRTQKKR